MTLSRAMLLWIIVLSHILVIHTSEWDYDDDDDDDDHYDHYPQSSPSIEMSFLSSSDFARAEDKWVNTKVDYTSNDPETAGDFGYFEGDMMIKQREEEMVAKFTAKRWPNGRIPYAMEKGKFSPTERAAIARGIIILEKLTCIRFVPRTKKDKDFVLMRRGPGCAAHVGRIGGRQFLFLGNGCFGIETVIHELMHSIGFIHEQSRPDRDNHVTILWENIKPEQKRNFRKHTTDFLADHGFPYDLLSAMHYRTHAFSKNRKPTIMAKRPVPYLRCRGNDCPSNWDVKKINFLYKCFGGKSNYHGKSSNYDNYIDEPNEDYDSNSKDIIDSEGYGEPNFYKTDNDYGNLWAGISSNRYGHYAYYSPQLWYINRHPQFSIW